MKFMVESPPVALQRLHVSMNYGDQGEIKYFEPWAYESIPGWAIVEYGLNACLWQTSSSCCRGGVPSKRPFEISYMTQKFAVCLPKKNPDDQECSEFQSAFPLTTVLWPRPNCSFCLGHNHHDHHESVWLDACHRMGEPSMQWIC